MWTTKLQLPEELTSPDTLEVIATFSAPDRRSIKKLYEFPADGIASIEDVNSTIEGDLARLAKIDSIRNVLLQSTSILRCTR